MDLFGEIKRQRYNGNEDDVTIDDASGSDIPEKFAEIYVISHEFGRKYTVFV